jgi:hypothetical protein
MPPCQGQWRKGGTDVIKFSSGRAGAGVDMAGGFAYLSPR